MPGPSSSASSSTVRPTHLWSRRPRTPHRPRLPRRPRPPSAGKRNPRSVRFPFTRRSPMSMTSLPMLRRSHDDANGVALMTELQSLGARWVSADGPGLSRAGGAGPSDHKALVLGGETLMVPIHTAAAAASPYAIRASGQGRGSLERNCDRIGDVSFPTPPRFYGETTAEGIPYWKIAQLHATDVLATTVLQQCVRYIDRDTACRVSRIGRWLAAGRTIARKTPAQLVEVAEAAVRLDGVKHMVMTTGTPGTSDRGARVLAEADR